jgi:hypothetical protein
MKTLSILHLLVTVHSRRPPRPHTHILSLTFKFLVLYFSIYNARFLKPSLNYSIVFYLYNFYAGNISFVPEHFYTNTAFFTGVFPGKLPVYIKYLPYFKNG